MPVVKKRKRTFLRKDLFEYEVEIKINLNKEDIFDFDIPDEYVTVFEQTSYPENIDIRGGKIRFERMTEFESCYDTVNGHFRREVITLTSEKMLVILLEARTENRSFKENAFRIKWGNNHDLNTFINFKFERAIRVGKVLYKVNENSGFNNEDNDGWERLSNTYWASSEANNSDPTRIEIAYTEEREKFLGAFVQELSATILKIDAFMKAIETPSMLSLIDNGGMNLLSAPAEQIEEMIDAEIEEKS